MAKVVTGPFFLLNNVGVEKRNRKEIKNYELEMKNYPPTLWLWRPREARQEKMLNCKC